MNVLDHIRSTLRTTHDAPVRSVARESKQRKVIGSSTHQGASSAAACPQELVRAVGAEEVPAHSKTTPCDRLAKRPRARTGDAPARLEMAPPGTVLDHRETDHAVRLGAWGRGQLEAECVHVIDQTKNEVELKVLGRMRLAVVVTARRTQAQANISTTDDRALGLVREAHRARSTSAPPGLLRWRYRRATRFDSEYFDGRGEHVCLTIVMNVLMLA